jgi:hypothetical protein
VFLDESIFRATSVVRSSWCKNGKRKQVPQQKWCCCAHVFGFLGVKHRSLIHLPNKGSGKSGGVNSDDFVSELSERITRVKACLSGKILMLDGASIHTSKTTREYLAKNEITTLPRWPANSPDLNPIKNWSAILS